MRKRYYLAAAIILAMFIVATMLFQNIAIEPNGRDALTSMCATKAGVLIGCWVTYAGYLFLMDIISFLVIIYLLIKADLLDYFNILAENKGFAK